MKALEEEARQVAERKREEQESKENRRGRPPKAPSDKPPSKRQRNFTDSESRIMKDSSTKSFQQCYNCQAAVDEKAQVIVAAHVTQAPNDKEQLEPVPKEILENSDGKKPKVLTADAGYFSEDNCNILAKSHIDGYVATFKPKHTEKRP